MQACKDKAVAFKRKSESETRVTVTSKVINNSRLEAVMYTFNVYMKGETRPLFSGPRSWSKVMTKPRPCTSSSEPVATFAARLSSNLRKKGTNRVKTSTN